jgi:hypothetical protein
MDPVIEFLQLRSTPFKDSAILAPKLADPPFWWKSLTPPPLNLDPVHRSGSMHILYYLKMFFIEIQLLRNQISSCQQVLYYISKATQHITDNHFAERHFVNEQGPMLKTFYVRNLRIFVIS